MITTHGKTLPIVALAALLAGGWTARAQNASDELQAAPDDARERSTARFVETPLEGRDGVVLGEIYDFLIGERSGRVAFVAVSSGGLGGFGDRLRFVPFDALQLQTAAASFSIPLSEQQWRELQEVGEDDFNGWGLAIERARLPREQAGAVLAPGYDAFERLIRTQRLPGKPVRAWKTDAGTIDAVVLDLTTGLAKVLLEPEREYAGSEHEVLVPFGMFAFSEGRDDAIAARFTRSDFNQLYASWNQTTGPRQPISVANEHREQRELPPLTDSRPADAGTPAGADRDAMRAAVSSVRRALESQDGSTGDNRVQVTGESGKLILSGAVADAAMKETVGRTARAAAGGIPVENQLRTHR